MTSILYAIVTTIVLVLPFVDPGIIPKILHSFEDSENTNIPYNA